MNRGASALAIRALTICAVLAIGGSRLAVRSVFAYVTRRGDPAEAAFAVAADTMRRLGPAFVKGGQLLSTRVDVLPRPACRALARLYDRVPLYACETAQSGTTADVTALLPKNLLADLDDATLTPVGAGSIAYVYRARLLDGREIAVKVRRPGVERAVLRDIALLRKIAAAVQRLPGYGAYR